MRIERVIIYPKQDNQIILEVGNLVNTETCITMIDVFQENGHNYILVFHNDQNKPSVAYAGVPYAVFYDLEEK